MHCSIMLAEKYYFYHAGSRVASIRLVAMHADQLHILASMLFFYIARIIRSILVAMHADQLSLDTNHCKCNLVKV